PSGRQPLRARRLPRTAAPVTGRLRSPPYLPGAMPASSRTRPSLSGRVRLPPREGTKRWAGTPRIVRVGPSSVKGTRRSFLTASQKRSPGPALERRSLCRPYGPDGEGQARGQAREARGEL